MRTGIFIFFFGLGAAGAALMSIGMPGTVSGQISVLLALAVLSAAAVAGCVSGEGREAG